jgi:hypothetical protein
MVYGTATFYGHLRFEPPTAAGGPVGVAARRGSDEGYVTALGASLGGGLAANATAPSGKKPARKAPLQ